MAGHRLCFSIIDLLIFYLIKAKILGPGFPCVCMPLIPICKFQFARASPTLDIKYIGMLNMWTS